MINAFKSYYEKLISKSDYFQNENYNNVDINIKAHFRNGIFPVKRNSETDFSVFREKYGYTLPEEIQEYINLYWHGYICGFSEKMRLYSDEAVILFPVLKYQGENDNDVLYHKFGLLELSDQWTKYGGNIHKFIPVGWTGYSGSEVLYNTETLSIHITDLDGNIIEDPIADSLSDLIRCLVP